MVTYSFIKMTGEDQFKKMTVDLAGKKKLAGVWRNLLLDSHSVTFLFLLALTARSIYHLPKTFQSI